MDAKDQHIEYFKALVEDRDDAEEWSSWFASHETDLGSWLSAGQILRLKRGPLYTICGILDECGFHYRRPEHYIHRKFHVPLVVPAAWLDKKVSCSLIEKELQKYPDLSTKWNILKARMSIDDECWTFRSPTETWQLRRGRAGYAIVRNGQPIDGIITMLN